MGSARSLMLPTSRLSLSDPLSFFLIHTHPSFISCWNLFSYLCHSPFLFFLQQMCSFLNGPIVAAPSFHLDGNLSILGAKQNQNIDFESITIPEIDVLAMKSQVCIFCFLLGWTSEVWWWPAWIVGIWPLLEGMVSQDWPFCLPGCYSVTEEWFEAWFVHGHRWGWDEVMGMKQQGTEACAFQKGNF